MKGCLFCDLKDKDDLSYVESYRFWDVRLSLEQHTLGCLIFVLREHKEGFSTIDEEEFLELRKISEQYENILRKKFGAVWFNHLITNNKVKHLHVHLIPRYDKSMTFAGKTFTDENYGNMVKQKHEKEDENFLHLLKKAFAQKQD